MEYKGIRAPITASKSGGFMVESGENQLKKIIMLQLDYCPSDNPFNDDVGIDYPVFDVNDISTQARTEIKIRDVFDRLKKQDRARLENIEWSSEGEELAADIEYYDMQTDRHDSLRYVATGGTA